MDMLRPGQTHTTKDDAGRKSDAEFLKTISSAEFLKMMKNIEQLAYASFQANQKHPSTD
jgi:hypothetical protein